MQGRAGHLAGAEFGGNTTSLTHHLNCFKKMLRFRLFLESRKVTSLGSFLAGAAEGSLGLAVGKEKSCSMLEKSGSTVVVQGLLSVAHMELCSEGGVGKVLH